MSSNYLHETVSGCCTTSIRSSVTSLVYVLVTASASKIGTCWPECILGSTIMDGQVLIISLIPLLRGTCRLATFLGTDKKIMCNTTVVASVLGQWTLICFFFFNKRSISSLEIYHALSSTRKVPSLPQFRQRRAELLDLAALPTERGLCQKQLSSAKLWHLIEKYCMS